MESAGGKDSSAFEGVGVGAVVVMLEGNGRGKMSSLMWTITTVVWDELDDQRSAVGQRASGCGHTVHSG